MDNIFVLQHRKILTFQNTEWSKSLCAPNDYSTKNMQKYRTLNSFNHLPW